MFSKRRIPASPAILLALALLGGGCGEIQVNFVLDREGKLPEAKEIERIREQEGRKPPKDQQVQKRINDYRSRVAKQEEAMRKVLFIMFGTPDEPHAWGNSGLDGKKLKMAAGPPADKTGLYRKHCAHCHGISGDGAGPTARFLNPYPRDYRQGKYKFKATYPTGAMPTRDDLQRTIREGINGTAMPSFKVMLRDDETEALAEYVVYLSMRGMVEREMRGVIDDKGIKGDTKLTEELFTELIAELRPDPEFKTPSAFARWQSVEAQWHTYHSNPAAYVKEQRELEQKLQEQFEQIGAADKKLQALAASKDAKKKDAKKKDAKKKDAKKKKARKDDDEAKQLQEALAKLRTEQQETNAQLEKLRTYFIPPERDAKQFAESRKIAASIFNDTTRANCVQCHGPTGLGDGGQINFDDWNQPKFDAMSKQGRSPEEINAMYNLPVQRIKPRNLRMGIYRGGRRPVDIYRRIAIGINGTPMPAHAAAGPAETKKLQPHEIWALVDYVLSLPYAEDGQRQHRRPEDKPLPQRGL